MTALAYAARGTTRKRAVNLSLNEQLVTEAKRFTDNLSATIEGLVAQFVQTKRNEQVSRQDAVNARMKAWNQVIDQHGSFADEHSTL